MVRQQSKTIPSVWHAQQGAIMVIGIFMACLLVGLLYYLAGLGQALVFRERMQDAGDSAAMAGAVIAARGMNLIALLNNFMAAMLAVQLTLIAADISARDTQIYAALRCSLTLTGSPSGLQYCLAQPFLFITTMNTGIDVSTKVPQIAERVRNAGHVASVLTRAMPEAARNKVAELGAEYYAGTTYDACLVGPFDSLPVRQTYICDEQHVRSQIPKLGEDPLKNSGGINMIDNLQTFAVVGLRLLQNVVSHEACNEGHLMKEGLKMGGEEFQFRVLVRGTPPFEKTYQGVKVAQWRTDNAEKSTANALRTLGQTAMAQAEFFYDEETDPNEWMWNMRWEARLRRFSVPRDGFTAPCASDITQFDTYNLDKVMVH